jgi:hypothetical protein
MDPVAAISAVSSNSTLQALQMRQDNQILDDCLSDCGGSIVLPPVVVTGVAPKSSMNVFSFSQALNDGLKNGFVAKEKKIAMDAIRNDVNGPDMTLAIMDYGTKLSMASALKNLSKQLVDGLQSVVLKG